MGLSTIEELKLKWCQRISIVFVEPYTAYRNQLLVYIDYFKFWAFSVFRILFISVSRRIWVEKTKYSVILTMWISICYQLTVHGFFKLDCSLVATHVNEFGCDMVGLWFPGASLFDDWIDCTPVVVFEPLASWRYNCASTALGLIISAKTF